MSQMAVFVPTVVADSAIFADPLRMGPPPVGNAILCKHDLLPAQHLNTDHDAMLIKHQAGAIKFPAAREKAAARLACGDLAATTTQSVGQRAEADGAPPFRGGDVHELLTDWEL